MDSLAYPHDSFVKAIWSRPELAASFLAHYLPPDVVAQLDTTAPELLPESFIDQDLRVHRTDLLYRVARLDGTPAFVYVLLEHKSTPAPRVGLQILRYLTRIWAWHDAQKGSSLPFIFPLVLYHGRRPWRVARQFAALTEDGENPAWALYVPHFEYFLCDLSAASGADIKGAAALRLAIAALQYASDPKLHERLPNILSLLREVHETSVLEFLGLVLRYFSQVGKVNRQQLREAAINATSLNIGESAMQSLAYEWMQEGVQQGRQEGLQQGVRQGLEEGSRQEAGRVALLLLRRRCGPVTRILEKRVQALPLPQLEALIEAVLDFQRRQDLEAWLAAHPPANAQDLTN